MSLKAFTNAHAILQELESMGAELASVTLYADGSGSLNLGSKYPTDPSKIIERAKTLVRSNRGWWNDQNEYVISSCYGFGND